MNWIISGVLLIIIGVYLKYQEYQAGNPVIIDEYLEKGKKLQNLNEELEELIQSIEEKEKALQIKIDNLLQLEDKLLEKSSKDPAEEKEQTEFKELLNREYSLAEEEESLLGEPVVGGISGKYQEVLQLAREGMATDEIARKLNLGIRETGLILRLYQKEEDSLV